VRLAIQVSANADLKNANASRAYLQALKSRLVAGFSVTGLVSFWLIAPIRKSARYEEALVR
jgi:heme O synthase-like polyprenyltransferase